MKVTLYHNNRCSTSRNVKKYLEELGADLTIIPYLTAELSTQEILELLQKVENPEAIMRQKEEEYKALDPKPNTLTEKAAAISEHPRVMERPIVECGEQAIVARPWEYFQNWIENKK